MKPFKKKKTIEAFWKGETSLKEEKLLKSHKDHSEPEQRYFRYLETQQIVPGNLESMVWKSVQKERSQRKHIYIRWAVAATAITIVGTILFLYQQRRNALLEEQFAILEHTLHHVSNEINMSPADAVLYQDEYIIIVANN